MRVFVTGAAGWLGSATVPELIKHGHTVLGLARSDANVEKLTKMGAEVIRGDLEDLEALRAGARSCDGVIHLAFMADFSQWDKVTAVDKAAVVTMGEELVGTGKPLVSCSGTLSVPKGVLATEDTPPERGTMLSKRTQMDDALFELCQKGVRGTIVRISPTAHGDGDKGLLPMIFGVGQKNGFLAYIGDGSNKWPAVHRSDAGVLFRLALEKGKAGSYYNAVAETVPMKDIQEVAGEALKLPVESKTKEQAEEALGFLGVLLGYDNPTSSEKTQKELGWKPVGPTLLEDLRANYFK